MEVYARELADGLQQLHEPDLVIEHVEPRSRLRGTTAVGPLGRVGGYVDRYIAYQCEVSRENAEVNHVIDHGYGHLAYSLNARRTVVTFHDAMLLKLAARELATDTYPRLTMLSHRLSLRAIRRCARVIADSESARHDFLRFVDYPSERVRVVPLGVAPHFRPTAGNDSVRENRRSFRILHVGHCGPYKNIESILRALPIINRQADRPVEFIKVGGPLMASQVALIEQLGIREQVRHLGMVPLADLPAVYASSDLLLMPSLYEGFGLPALEAMACGTPVVVSNQGSLPEVVGDAAVSVNPIGIQGIADGVARILANPLVQAEMRQRGLRQAARFTWQRTARETLGVYREVLEDLRD